MVTAEIAVALPSLVMATLAAVTALLACVAQVRAIDAAAVAARLSARGQSAVEVVAAARVVAPGADVSIHRQSSNGSDLVVAQISLRVPVLGVGRLLPAFVVRERAVAPAEAES